MPQPFLQGFPHGATRIGLTLSVQKKEDARALVRELFVSSADLEPNEQDKTLTICIHRMACPAHNKAIGALLADLNQLAFHHPETNARLIYELA